MGLERRETERVLIKARSGIYLYCPEKRSKRKCESRNLNLGIEKERPIASIKNERSIYISCSLRRHERVLPEELGEARQAPEVEEI